MASNINPNNIDGAYPVAGQDNNSQGFRDNFTNIKLNFQYAEDEINDLDSKVLLKAPLEGQASLNNNMNEQVIYNAQIRDFSATRVAISQTSGSIAIDYATGHYQTINTTGSISLSFTNWPTSGLYAWVRVQINITNAAYTVTLPSAVSRGINNLQGYDSATRAITFAQTGYYVLEFTTSTGNGAITVEDLSRNVDPIFLPSSEDLADGADVSLDTTASYFSTSAAETAQLNAGYNGQIKTLMAYSVTGGNMVITVANAGWKSSGTGTITFSSRGAACTMQYINSKWFCIGNNGAAFA